MIEKCPDCPAAGRCIVQATAHTPYCDWASSGGLRRDRVAELSAELDAGMPDAAAPSASEAMALVRSMNACQYRSTVGCGCSGAACALRKTHVSHLDCFACVRAFGDS